MNKTFSSLLTLTVLSVNALAYDAKKAEDLNAFYSPMTQKACANSTLFVDAENTMKMLRENNVTLLDVRTQAEADVLALSGKNALFIPIEHLFEKTNLDRLPTNKPIVVVCHSGTRGLLATIGLKQLGFKQIQVLKGGMIALAEANTPKNAPIK